MFTFRIDDEVSLALPRPQADADALFALITADRPVLAHHFAWVNGIENPADEQRWLRQALVAFAQEAPLHLVIHYCDEIAGMIAFTHPDFAQHSTTVSFWLGADYRRQHIMGRALAGMCALGFTDYPWQRLVLRIAADNQAAQHLATNTGFTREADGHGVLQYARLKTD